MYSINHSILFYNICIKILLYVFLKFEILIKPTLVTQNDTVCAKNLEQEIKKICVQ